jgi:hypothetical protein
MELEHKKIVFSPLVLAAIFVSIFKYEIAGSIPVAVGIGSIAISAGITAVVDALIRGMSTEDSKLRTRAVLVGSIVISAPLYYVFYSVPSTSKYIRDIYLVLLITIAITYIIGKKVAEGTVDGLRHGFVTSGIASTLLVLLVFFKAMNRDVFYGGIVVISSVSLPVVIGTIGGIFGVVGALSRRPLTLEFVKSKI